MNRSPKIVAVKRPVGRPRKPVDTDLIYKLAKIHCTTEEISWIVGVSRDTIERNYAAILNKGREMGKARLRRYQYLLAKSGNATMLIWLGKQMLGQRERLEHTGEDGGPIHVTLADTILRDAGD